MHFVGYAFSAPADRTRGVRRLLLAAALAAVLVLPTAASPRSGALPPLPRDWPRTLQVGLTDDGDAGPLRRSVRLGLRYTYLAGGVNTGGGWSTWQPNGGFVSHYDASSFRAGITPVFSYYMIRQSKPGGGDETKADLANLNNLATMRAYWADVELFFRRARARKPVVLHVEPDLWGYVEYAAKRDDAASVPAKVAATGLADLAGLPDTAAGAAQAFVRLRDRLAPNVLLAWHLSGWGTREDIGYSDPPLGHVDAVARKAARFYRSFHARFDLVFTDASDADAAYKQKVDGDHGASWWRAGDYRRFARLWSTFSHAAGKRVVVWQIPLGNTKMRAQNNTLGHFQDNHVEWWLGDGARAHMRALAKAGVVGLLFGGGGAGSTCACDARHDGITNPPPIDGNARPSLNADDDGGYFKAVARAYLRHPVRLPAR
jgi:hypothetical protein